MKGYRRGAHSVFEIHLNLVFTTKYRKKLLAGEVGQRVGEVIREVVKGHDVTILKGHVAKDHVHLFVFYRDRWFERMKDAPQGVAV
jgi:putative transposase